MSLRALRTLAAIAQHGSFARAAEAVCLTQSAVSLHVRTLEEAFNAPLFDRSRRTPTLTEAGRRAVERAREILAIYDGIAGELGEGGELAGRLRIGAIQTALAGVLPAALAALRRQHPRLRVQVYSGMSAELASRLDAGELDPAAGLAVVPPLILQPLLENAIRHGVEPSDTGAAIRVRTQLRGNRVRIVLANTFPAGPGAPGNGMALENVRNRLALCHDMELRFSAKVVRDRFVVRIEVPMQIAAEGGCP